MARVVAIGMLIGFSCAAVPRAAAQAAESGQPDYTARLGEGLVASAAGDRGAALAAFRAAVQLEPSRPDAVCFLAETLRAAGDDAAALESFNACLRVARAAAEQRWIARALHGVASTLERLGRAEEARAAWQEYVRFADGAAAIASPQTGRSRITAIDQAIELERVMVEVRQRIAERSAQRGAGSGAGGAGTGTRR